ncbi:hypothetical protein ABB37_03499 [Leptomonas pyrrhocoris]|uniref:Uncharacterized protein n=1 Tax=Leptomonas pyrrhocoris TaxID=157538 RepID=A0A0M9G4T6_LEPPY|nr:hypothetical protein ABB37_03499 [Leptomonas pyrrhocoris]KPA82430.1 hypothetical protein ABB37_03499 [Leptomonas pyrrhocoris]|eukprot:XP_015660869.1 hypothetical protein ABB37_03499 [Leptomonas pyrrhocoris]
MSLATSSAALGEAVQRTVTGAAQPALWTPQQRCYRELMRALRGAYYHDRSKLFWARHRVLVEFYKYSRVEEEKDVALLVGIGGEVAAFVTEYMKVDVGAIMQHNEKMLSLPVAVAKRYREDYLLHEKQHDSWCKQKIRLMMDRRPPPPYPFF